MSVEELGQIFDVSSVTVRSDLTYLEEQRYLVRLFGKARYLAQKAGENILAPVADEATRKASEITIARFAAEAVDDHASLMLGAGELAHKILPFLSDRSNLALMLHDLDMARTAQRFLSCELALTGGQLEDGGMVLTGPDAEAWVSRRTRSRRQSAVRGSGDRTRVCGGTQGREEDDRGGHQPQLNERHGEAFASLAHIDALLMDNGIDPPTMELMPQKNLPLYRRETSVLEFRNASRKV